MNMRKYTLKIAPELHQFLQDCDYVFGNFEATLTEETCHQLDQKQDRKIILSLAELVAPNKWILSIANNHAGDFGRNICAESEKLLKEAGFQTLGFKEKQRLAIQTNLAVTTGTMWSNRLCNYVADLPSIDAKLPLSTACEILYPHWGYEMELYPRPNIMSMANSYLQNYTCIVGHHSHVPQPITVVTAENPKIVAYSLGNFCSGFNIQKYSYGEVFKADFGFTTSGHWAIGNLDWSFTRCMKMDQTTFQVSLVNTCAFHPNI
ncbi:MAG: CapA family protein [Candidatus Brocadiae bacterium]|nr:CapA family protein [Candidatus Brocadiia bacterium]